MMKTSMVLAIALAVLAACIGFSFLDGNVFPDSPRSIGECQNDCRYYPVPAFGWDILGR